MKALVIGLGGVGTVAAYTLQRKIPVYALVKSNIENVKSHGYTINSIDYGEINYRPTKVVESFQEAVDHGPFDYIIIATKIIPKPSGNIWDYVKEHHQLYTKNTSIVLFQNGINIEKYWTDLDVNLISGVSYISSTKNGITIDQVAPDEVSFGLFKGDAKALETFVDLYQNDINQVNITIDNNVRFIRMKKLLYNGSFNTLCSLTNTDVGVLYEVPDMVAMARLLMAEITTVANEDLKKHGSDKFLSEKSIDDMIQFALDVDVPNNYEPSMMVDSNNGREIEIEVILGNLIEIHGLNGGKPEEIPNLNFVYNCMKLIQFKLQHKKI